MSDAASQLVSCAEMSSTSGQVSTTGQTERKKRGRPCKPITDKPRDVTMMTTSSVTMTAVTHGNDTVPCIQQHCVIPVQHSAVSAPDIKQAGWCVVAQSQHGAIASEPAQQHSAVIISSPQRHSASTSKSEMTHGVSRAVTTTTATTTTHSGTTTHDVTTTSRHTSDLKDSSTAVNLSGPSAVMYPGDCAVSMLWLADQPTFGTHNIINDDNDDAVDTECKLMMSPMTSFHLIPLVPHPYPCIEPMYVDMATVGVATTGVGIAADDVVVATDNDMATMETAGVSMAAVPLVGHSLQSVDGSDVSNPLVWPTLYPCTESCLATFDPPTHIVGSLPPTLSARHSGIEGSAELINAIDIAGSNAVSKLGVPTCSSTIPSSPSQSKPTAYCYNTGAMTLTDSVDNDSLIMGGPFTLAQSRHELAAGVYCQQANNADGNTAADNVEEESVKMSTSSRPDVVSSNIPRSYAATTTSSSTSAHNHSYCSSNLTVSCSSVLHGLATTRNYDSSTTTTATTTVASSSSDSNTGISPSISVVIVDANADGHQQQQDGDSDGGESDELLHVDAAVLPVNVEPDSPRDQPAAAAAAAADTDVDVNTGSCVKSLD